MSLQLSTIWRRIKFSCKNLKWYSKFEALTTESVRLEMNPTPPTSLIVLCSIRCLLKLIKSIAILFLNKWIIALQTNWFFSSVNNSGFYSDPILNTPSFSIKISPITICSNRCWASIIDSPKYVISISLFLNKCAFSRC